MKQLLYIFILIYPSFCYGQTDSIIMLDNVIVNATKLETVSIGKLINTIDSATLYTKQFGTLQQQLGANSSVFIKNYGSNNLSTLSVRGNNASQVATVWNGFNLNMLSQSMVDMNLIPSFFIDKLAIEYGASTSKNGGGAIGASILLNSNLPLQIGHVVQLGHQVASFNNNCTNGKYYFSNARFANSTKFIVNNATNNFLYYPNGSTLFEKQNLPNNQFTQIGILQENKLIINKKHQLLAGFWWQNTSRQLPPSVTSTNTNETQDDNHTRVYLHVNGNYGQYQHNARIAASKEYLRYVNPLIKIDDDYITNRWMVESEHVVNNKLGNFSFITQYNFGEIVSKNYLTNAIQHRLSFQANFIKLFFKNKLQSAMSAKQEFVTNHQIPITFSINSSYYLSKNWKINAVVNNMYRIPTFNDLFWAGTGNPNLKSEHGFGQDLGIVYTSASEKLINNKLRKNFINITELGLTTFNRTINDWIIWTPNGSNIWTPQNILQVWSRGLELQIHAIAKIKNLHLNADIHYAFTKSTNEKVRSTVINTLHQQLIYTPTQLLNSTLSMQYSQWQLIVQQQFVGQRFTTSDNLSALPIYYLTNMQARKKIQLASKEIAFGAGINNLTNNNYQVIAYKPMPLRNYFLSLQLQIHQ